MKFDALIELVGELPWFDLATLVQLTDERRTTLTNQLYRFAKAGKIVPIRRGMYALAERYRRAEVQPAELAGAIYRPSYLSGVWALSFYGLIPESVPVYTSVTTRTPRRFENPFGLYTYRNVQREMFFGFEPVEIMGRKVLLATPEKALVDHWHLEHGAWTEARMAQMRFSPTGIVDMNKLQQIVTALGKPRLRRAWAVFARIAGDETDAEVPV